MPNSRRRLSTSAPPSPVQSPMPTAEQAVASDIEGNQSGSQSGNQSSSQSHYDLPNHQAYSNKRQRSCNEELKTEPFSLTLNSSFLSIITNNPASYQSLNQPSPTTETRMSPVTLGISNFSVQDVSPQGGLQRSRSYADSSTVSLHSITPSHSLNQLSSRLNDHIANPSQVPEQSLQSMSSQSDEQVNTSHDVKLGASLSTTSAGSSVSQSLVSSHPLNQLTNQSLVPSSESTSDESTTQSGTKNTDSTVNQSCTPSVELPANSNAIPPASQSLSQSTGTSNSQSSTTAQTPIRTGYHVVSGTYNNLYSQQYVMYNNQVYPSNHPSLNQMYLLNPAMYVQAFNPSIKQTFTPTSIQSSSSISSTIPVASPVNMLSENMSLVRARTAPPLDQRDVPAYKSVNHVVTSMTEPWPRAHRAADATYERYLFHFPDSTSHGAQGGLYQPGKPSQLYIELVHTLPGQAPTTHSICLPVKVAQKPTVKESATVRRFDELALHPNHLVCPTSDLATEEVRYLTGAEMCEPQYLLLRHDWKCPVSVVQVVKYQRSLPSPNVTSPLHLLAVAESSLAHTQTRGRGKNDVARKETAQLYLSFTLNAYYELHAHSGWKIERMLISHFKGGIEVAQSPISFTQLNQETSISDAVSAIQLLAGSAVMNYPTAALRKPSKSRHATQPVLGPQHFSPPRQSSVPDSQPECHSPDVETASQFIAALAEQHRQSMVHQRSQSAADHNHLALLSSAAAQSGM